jgi:hypothetical protein
VIRLSNNVYNSLLIHKIFTYLHIYKTNQTSPKGAGGGEGGGSYFADKCIQGPCFLDNEGSVKPSVEYSLYGSHLLCFGNITYAPCCRAQEGFKIKIKNLKKRI